MRTCPMHDSPMHDSPMHVCMRCQAGGGFIFDTNSIHKGTPIGTDDRTTIIYE